MHDARLYDKPGSTIEVLPALEHASVVKVREGLLLRGLENAGYQKHQRQGWWVLPGPLVVGSES